VSAGAGDHARPRPGAATRRPNLVRAAVQATAREPVLLGLLAFGAAFFAYRWAVDLQRPGALFPEGWRGYNDQGFYFREAVAIGNFEAIPRDQFAYGPGYPFLAAPFAVIGEFGWPLEDPFLPANAVVWLVTMAAVYLLGRRLYGEWAGIAASLAVALATPLIGTLTLPWNTTPVLGCVMVCALVALRRRLEWWHGAILGAAVSLAFASRYLDAVWILLLAVTVLIARGALHPRAPALWGGVIAGLVTSVPSFYMHHQTFGTPFTTSYSENLNAGQESFDLADIPSHALQSLVSPFFFGDNGQSQPMLSSMFLIVLAPVGVWLLVRAARGPRRILVVGFAATSLLATLTYWAYWFTGSFGLGFGSLHFFKAWWPLWTLAGVAAVVEIGRWSIPRVRSRRAVHGGHAARRPTT